MVTPSDFILEPPRPEDYMDAEFAAAFMDSWAKSNNQSHEVAAPPAGWESNQL